MRVRGGELPLRRKGRGHDSGRKEIGREQVNDRFAPARGKPEFERVSRADVAFADTFVAVQATILEE